jgi:DNA primase
VGVATLGTALTERQADLLRPYIRDGGPGILVATDNDPAGQQAAERIYWQLTARGDNPRRLALPDGLDPADLLHHRGTTALQTAIDTTGSLAEGLLDARLSRALHDGDAAGPQAVLRDVSALIVALPPGRWLAYIDRVTAVLGVPPGTVHGAVLDTEPITAAPRRTPTGRPQAPRSAPTCGDLHRTAQSGQPSHSTRPDRHHSR